MSLPWLHPRSRNMWYARMAISSKFGAAVVDVVAVPVATSVVATFTAVTGGFLARGAAFFVGFLADCAEAAGLADLVPEVRFAVADLAGAFIVDFSAVLVADARLVAVDLVRLLVLGAVVLLDS